MADEPIETEHAGLTGAPPGEASDPASTAGDTRRASAVTTPPPSDAPVPDANGAPDANAAKTKPPEPLPADGASAEKLTLPPALESAGWPAAPFRTTDDDVLTSTGLATLEDDASVPVAPPLPARARLDPTPHEPGEPATATAEESAVEPFATTADRADASAEVSADALLDADARATPSTRDDSDAGAAQVPPDSPSSGRGQGPAPAPAAPASDGAPASPAGETVGLGAVDAQEHEATPGLSGASQLPPAPIEAIEAVAAAVGRLRAEVSAAGDGARRARLLGEAAEIQERAGDEQGAARDYLAAYNADTTFREPLEGLLRLLERRRSLANLGRLIEALVAAAITPEERARALTQRAVFAQDVQSDLEGARGAAREATETGAMAADLGPAWLTLELVAAKLGDSALREEALASRAETTTDRGWRGLLLVDAARLTAAGGEVDRALETLERVRALASAATYEAALETERIVRAEPGLAGTAEASRRARMHAEALEARADLVRDAISDPSTADSLGVPEHVRHVEHVADLLLRAAEARRTLGELPRAAQALDRALDTLAVKSRRADDGDEHDDTLGSVERLVLEARLRVAELMGDVGLAAEVAARRLVGETDGGVAAALAMRIAEHASEEGDVARALDALHTATRRDPLSAPARALSIDLLQAQAEGGPLLAELLEDTAKHFAHAEAKGRALLLAGFVWAARAADARRARSALEQAAECGAPKGLVTQLARSLASLLGDDAWYEESTGALLDLASGTGDAFGSLFAVELVRLARARGDASAAAKALAKLREMPEGAWLARVLVGLVPDETPVPQGPETMDGDAASRAALSELAEGAEDPALRRSLVLLSALRDHASGDAASAIGQLRTLAIEDARDPLVSALLADLVRGHGDDAATAAVVAGTAEALEEVDPDHAAARHLEVGFTRFRMADRAGALAAFEAAQALAREAAAPAASWSRRAIDVDGLDGRRAALDHAHADSGTALERFGLEALLGDPDDAASALASVELASNQAIRLAGALARLAWPRGTAEEDAALGALEALSATGPSGRTAAAAERLRLAREGVLVTTSDDVAAAAAHWLDEGGGSAAALEWLTATIATSEPAKEVPARRALAELLSDEAREALHASATLLDAVLRPDTSFARISGTSMAARLANLELSPPGSDPRRRAAALAALDRALGEDSELDALALAGWSALATGEGAAALDMFRTVTAARADDLAAWEGMRASAEILESHESYAVACEQLGARSVDDGRGAAFWEQAALAWSKLGEPLEQRAEAALEASFGRDPTRPVAFDRLFRRVRDRKDNDKVLALIATRLSVTDDPQEIAKLYWEQARALREKGDPDGALAALEHVTMMDEHHVGALALTGEIFIRRGMFVEAAESLAKLARVDGAPAKNRVTAGVAAVDLYENKLGRHDLALGVLVDLHTAGLSTLPVRERLARAAARTGSWQEATAILEQLMNERAEPGGRIEAARLAMAIHRDRLRDARAALPSARKLLAEAPGDGEALDLVTALDPQTPGRTALLERGRDALLAHVHEHPNDGQAHARLARVSHALGDELLEQSALACSVSLLGPDGSSEQMVALLSSRKPRVPQAAMTEATLQRVLAPGDDGAIASLFQALGPTIAEALGPLPVALGVTKKDRVDPRAGLALRNEIAAWAGTFGIATFDLFIGGKDPGGIQGVPGETPALVVGAAINAPLSPTTRARVARELLGIVRGTAILRARDDQWISAILIAACKLAKVPVDQPPNPVLAEVERFMNKAISGKTRKLIEPLCRAYVAGQAGQAGQAGHADSRQWAARALASQNRVAVVASGDVSVVLADVLGAPVDQLGSVARDDLRAHELFRFVLSRPYFEARRALGLEGQS